MNVILEEWPEIFSEISGAQHSLFRAERPTRRAMSKQLAGLCEPLHGFHLVRNP
jgi:hypothetical protein